VPELNRLKERDFFGGVRVGEYISILIDIPQGFVLENTKKIVLDKTIYL